MAEKATGIPSEFENTLKSLLKPTRELGGALGLLNKVLGEMLTTVNAFSEVQQAAIELSKSVGLAGKSIMAIATRTIEQNRKMQLSAAYNMSSEEMIKMQGQIMGRLGRNIAVDQVGTVQRNEKGEVVNPNFDSELENLIAASQVFGVDRVAEITAGFDRVGKSMKSATKMTGKLFKEAGEYGINLDKYAENFTSNLQMAQTYNFRKGVDGLKEMARKATEIRQDMKQIAAFADKVGSVTGAVETAAQLQVLGGSFSSLANPLAMLNESLTNMEGLQDRLTDMTQGMATYNQETHQIEMNAYDRMRIKRAAEAMGVDPNNLIDQAYAQARRTEIQNQMMGMGNLSEEFKKMVPNIGEIDSETGAAGVTIGGQFRSLSELASLSAEEQMALQQQLVEENRSESEDIKVIAKSVMGIEDIVSGKGKQMRNAAARNDIMPGAVGGVSKYDMVLNAATERMNEAAIQGAANIDLFTGSIETFIDYLGTTAISDLAGIMSANSPGEAGERANKLITDLFGTSNAVVAVGNAFESATTAVAGFVKGIADYMTQYGFNPLPGNGATEYTGREGSTATPVARNVNEDAASVLATQQDTITEATYRSRNGGRQPVLEPLANPLGMLNNQVVFSGNENSIPGASVTPWGSSVQTQSQQTAQTGNGGTTSSPYNLNISGSLTMTVNGDKGNMGTVDIVKLIQNDADFRRMLAAEIAKAMKEIDSR